MLKLPPHLTNLLQPLDVGVFKPMKAIWYSVVADHTRRERRPITKRDFPSLLSQVWRQYNEETGKGGFRKCGIYPFNGDVVPSTAFKHSQPFNNQLLQTAEPTQSTSSQGTPPVASSTQVTPPITPQLLLDNETSELSDCVPPVLSISSTPSITSSQDHNTTISLISLLEKQQQQEDSNIIDSPHLDTAHLDSNHSTIFNTPTQSSTTPNDLKHYFGQPHSLQKKQCAEND